MQHPVRGFFHAAPLIFSDNYCLLPEEDERYFFNIIITPRVTCINENNLVHIERADEVACDWYNASLTVKPDGTKKKYKWNIKKIDQSKMPKRIPEQSSIIVYMQPDWVEKLCANCNKSHSVVHLPTIVLKNSVSKQEFKRGLDEIALGFPDINKFCCRLPQVCQKQGNCVITKTLDT